jgi:hypothetical protein
MEVHDGVLLRPKDAGAASAWASGRVAALAVALVEVYA